MDTVSKKIAIAASDTIGILAILFLAVLAACSSSTSGNDYTPTAPAAAISAPASVIASQSGYAASVPLQSGCT